MATPIWIDDTLAGMREHFLGNNKIHDAIKSRFYEVAAEEWINAVESLQSTERSPRSMRWADYRFAGGVNSRTLQSDSDYQKLALVLNFYAALPKHSRELFSLFYDALSSSTASNFYSGTWNQKTVKGVRFDLESLASDFNESYRQAETTCNLVITVTNA